MEVVVIRHDDELQHHGIKGMKWGQRRFQNPDGSLTERGKKRYNKEVEKLKAEEKKIKEAEKVAKTKAKTQAKFDKLDAKKAELEERKKKLKNGDTDDADGKPVETPEQKKARLLNSSNAKEIYENRDLFTYQELNDRVNRIDLEARLSNKIPAEPTPPSAMDRVDKATNAINKATGLYRSVDGAVSTVANSYMGKALADALGIELPKKNKTDWNAKLKDVDNLDPDDAMKVNKMLTARKSIKKALAEEKAENDAAEAAKKAAKDAEDNKAKAQKEVDDYNKKWQQGESDDRVGSKETTYGKSGDDITDNKVATGKASNTTRIGIEQIDRAETDGKVYGEGTSRYSGGSKGNVYDAEYGRDYWDANPSSGSVKTSNMTNSNSYSIGQNYIAGLLEYKEDK